MGWHQIQSESMIDPSKIQLLAATGHLSRCVKALDSDRTIDPDIADIVAKHPGNENIMDSNAETKHDAMNEEDWEKLLHHPRNKWPEEPGFNILLTLDTQAAGALT